MVTANYKELQNMTQDRKQYKSPENTQRVYPLLRADSRQSQENTQQKSRWEVEQRQNRGRDGGPWSGREPGD